LGRIHIDVDNSFVYEECGLEGLVELSRLTRLPLQEMVRSSIGSAMSSLQLYAATKNDVLIPWAKREPEEFKTALELLEADRGGFILEPKVGVYEGVGEIDFGSFYPTMMEKYNISPETVLCKCCPNSKVRVLGMGYNICERRKGLIPQVLGQVLRKRSEYKRRMKEGCDLQLREVYNRRQSALKWILVTCFGYLGYKNARFGRIEAHESVTAFARENLIRAVKISEARGFEVIHGMVDSLWVRKSGASNPELISLCRDIERETSLPVSFEGLYSWIVFLPSRVRPAVPALNRFYGVLSDGGLKARGILMRCKDTPKLIRRFQANALEEMSKAKGVGEIGGRVDGVIRIARKYARDLMLGKVRVDDLAICRQISRHPLDYEAEAHTAIAARQMFESGIHLQPGQTVAYVVTEAGARNPNLRLKALLLAATNYDKNWYLNLLVTAAEELLGPLGYARDTIAELLLSKTKQVEL
jgi:DNA polymerase elongation subunit (family B)